MPELTNELSSYEKWYYISHIALALTTVPVAVFGAYLAWRALIQVRLLKEQNSLIKDQLGKLANSNTIACQSLRAVEQSNRAIVVAHCANRYEKIMGDLYNFSVDEDSGRMPQSQTQVAEWTSLWWYRVWDLYVEEFILYRHGLLPKSFFKVWMNELCLKFPKKPVFGRVEETWQDGFDAYINDMFQADAEVFQFFTKIKLAANNYPDLADPNKRREHRKYRQVAVAAALDQWDPVRNPIADEEVEHQQLNKDVINNALDLENDHVGPPPVKYHPK
ncbi:MAG: hypothetical protein AAF483_22500 [Planctomycetota bacterium]